MCEENKLMPHTAVDVDDRFWFGFNEIKAVNEVFLKYGEALSKNATFNSQSILSDNPNVRLAFG